MATTIKRVGFGQVEPNHLSAQRTAQIYAQLPAASTIDILENGQFAKYDAQKGEVNFTGEGEWMLVMNEVKLYDGWRETYKDFAMIKDNYTPGSADITHYGVGPFPGQMAPRLLKTNVGDIYTTNCVGGANTSGKALYAGIELDVGDKVAPDAATGYLVKTSETEGMLWNVDKITTMPDMQVAVKLRRVQ